MEIEELKQHLDTFLEIFGEDTTHPSDDEWQTLIYDDENPKATILLIIFENETPPYYKFSIQLSPFSEFSNFKDFQHEVEIMLEGALDEMDSPFFNVYTNLKNAMTEWNESQNETLQTIFSRLQRFDDIPIVDTSSEIITKSNYTQCICVWKDFHYHTIKIPITRNTIESIERIIDITGKITNYKHVISYPIIRFYNDEIWLMRQITSTSLFDVIFNIDNIAEPLSQLMKGMQYIYSRGLFHGNITKHTILCDNSTKIVNIVDWAVIYLLEGNFFPDSEILLLAFDYYLNGIASLIERNFNSANRSVQLSAFIQTLSTYDSIDLTPLIKLAEHIPSTASSSSSFELTEEYERVKSLSALINFSVYFRKNDNQFYAFQPIDETALPPHVASEVKNRLFKFCQKNSHYFQYYFFTHPSLMVRMSITEVPLNSYLREEKLFNNKQLTRELYFKIASAVLDLHNDSIGHGSLSLKHIFIMDKQIKLAFFDLISPQSVLMNAIKKKSSTINKIREIFEETTFIENAVSVEHIVSISQTYDSKSQKVFRSFLTDQPLLFTLTEYFTQQQAITKRNKNEQLYFSFVDDSLLLNGVFIAGNNLAPPITKRESRFLASNGVLYRFHTTPILSTTSEINTYSLFKNSTNNIQITSTHPDRSFFSKCSSSTILTMADGNDYTLQYNFPTYLIELAIACSIPIDYNKSYKFLHSLLCRASITDDTLKNILKEKKTTNVIEIMKTDERFFNLAKLIEINTIEPLLQNNQSFLCFESYCQDCKTIQSCPHSFLCYIHSINPSVNVGHISVIDYTPGSSSKPHESEPSPNKSHAPTQPPSKSSLTSPNAKCNKQNTNSTTFKNDNKKTLQLSTSSSTSSSPSPSTSPLPPPPNKDDKKSSKQQIPQPQAQDASVNSTPVSGKYHNPASIQQRTGFVCDLMIYDIQPIPVTPQQLNFVIVSTICCVDVLKLCNELRSQGYIVQSFCKEEISIKEAMKQIDGCNTLIFYDGTFTITSGDSCVKKNTYEEVIEMITTSNDSVEIIELKKKELVQISTENKSTERVSVSIFNKSLSKAEIEKFIETEPYKKHLQEQDLCVVLSSKDKNYVRLSEK
ncbi:Protein kinase domain-containing protein [Entamoeba marina]